MNSCLLATALFLSNAVGQSMYQAEIDAQNAAFQRLWGTEFNWTFDELPQSAQVAEDRVPYSGYIYPDTHGGTVSALRKYDQAFEQGNSARIDMLWVPLRPKAAGEKGNERGNPHIDIDEVLAI